MTKPLDQMTPLDVYEDTQRFHRNNRDLGLSYFKDEYWTVAYSDRVDEDMCLGLRGISIPIYRPRPEWML